MDIKTQTIPLSALKDLTQIASSNNLDDSRKDDTLVVANYKGGKLRLKKYNQKAGIRGVLEKLNLIKYYQNKQGMKRAAKLFGETQKISLNNAVKSSISSGYIDFADNLSDRNVLANRTFKICITRQGEAYNLIKNNNDPALAKSKEVYTEEKNTQPSHIYLAKELSTFRAETFPELGVLKNSEYRDLAKSLFSSSFDAGDLELLKDMMFELEGNYGEFKFKLYELSTETVVAAAVEEDQTVPSDQNPAAEVLQDEVSEAITAETSTPEIPPETPAAVAVEMTPIAAAVNPKKEAKSSLTDWVSQMYGWFSGEMAKGDVVGAYTGLERRAYMHYSSDKPAGLTPLTGEAQVAYVKAIKGLSLEFEEQLNITCQSMWDRLITQDEVSDRELKEFAFRFLPKDRRPTSDGESYARITVNIKPEAAPKLAKAMAQLVADPDFADIVSQAKIMGPTYQGTRTDAAVIYLQQPSSENAEKVALYLSQHSDLDVDDFIDHTPAGMHRFKDDLPDVTGISYAETWETGRHSDTSHGNRRARLISDTVKALFEEFGKNGVEPTSVQIEEALEKVLEENGFDKSNPALLGQKPS